MADKFYEIRDPIHGLIKLNDLEREVINAPAFQRLRRIRQLALTDYVYPGAMHTRFEHSIGVMHLASRLFDRLANDERSREILRNEFKVNDDDFERRKQFVRLSALLHDVGHGPFSHAAEELFPRKANGEKGRIPHEQYSADIIKYDIETVIKSHNTSNQLGLDASGIASLIYGTPTDRVGALLKDIVSGTLDADRMDYLLRDAHHCGVRYGQYDLERIINTVGICEDFEENGEYRIGINDDGKHAAEGLVIARYMMFTQVYMHKTRAVYDFHFGHCMKELLAQNDGVFPGPNTAKSRNEFLAWDDWRVLGEIQAGGGGPHGGIIRDRKHHRLVYETQENYGDLGGKERADKKFNRVMAELTKAKFDPIELESSKSWYNFQPGSDVLLRDANSTKLTGTPLSSHSNVVRSLLPVNQRRVYVPIANQDAAKAVVEKVFGRRD